MTATADAISKYTAAYYAIILGFFLTNFIIFPRIQLSSAAPVFFFSRKRRSIELQSFHFIQTVFVYCNRK